MRYVWELGQFPIACDINCPIAPVDTPGLLPDTNGDTWGVWRLMPGFPGPNGSPTAAELSGEHSLAGTLGSLIAPAGAAAARAPQQRRQTARVFVLSSRHSSPLRGRTLRPSGRAYSCVERCDTAIAAL